MISPRNVDTDKARVLISHLNRAAGKVKEKDIAREQLEDQLKKIKKLSKAKNYRKEMRELEKKLSNVLEKEEELIMHQKKRDIFFKRLRERIDELEKKLTRYIDTKKLREKKLAEVEDQVRRRYAAEQHEIDLLEEHLAGLQGMFERISTEKFHTRSELERVKEKIEELKGRLGKVKK